MAKKMLVHLTNNPQKSINWLIVDENGQTIRAFDKEIIEDCDIYVTVPGSDVLLTSVNLPRLSATQLEKAIPFALSDQLAEDTNQLHFTVGVTSNKEDPLPVCIVNKEKMQHWQTQLGTLFKNMRPNFKKLLPETLLLPWQQGEWSIVIDNDYALVRTDLFAGFEIESVELWPLLRMLISKQDKKPTALIFYGTTSIPLDEVTFYKNNKISMQLFPQKKPQEILVEGMANSPAINLWQGEYKINYRTKTTKVFYLATAVLAGIWLATLTLGLLSQYFILKQKDKVLDQQIVKYYRNAFPDKKMVTRRDLKRSVETVLQKDTQGRGFINVMTRISPPLAAAKDIKVLGLDYSPSQLIIAVQTNDFANLDKLRQTLKQQNTSSELRDAVKTGAEIKANLVIKFKGTEKS